MNYFRIFLACNILASLIAWHKPANALTDFNAYEKYKINKGFIDPYEEHKRKLQEKAILDYLPPQEFIEVAENIKHDRKFDIVYNANIFYGKQNPLDITEEQKKQLQEFKKIKRKTKEFIAKQEDLKFFLSKENINCEYDDVGKRAIGYGDNEFLVDKPYKSNEKFCVTRDLVDWIFHKQIMRRTAVIEASVFYKKWASKLGDDYLVGIYSKIYQSSPEAFLKSKVYKLMLENPIKNQKLIESEWVRWKQEHAKNRRRTEWAFMTGENNKVYANNFNKQPAKPKTLQDALNSLGI